MKGFRREAASAVFPHLPQSRFESFGERATIEQPRVGNSGIESGLAIVEVLAIEGEFQGDGPVRGRSVDNKFYQAKRRQQTPATREAKAWPIIVTIGTPIRNASPAVVCAETGNVSKQTSISGSLAR